MQTISLINNINTSRGCSATLGTLIKRVHPGHVARALPPVLHSVQTIRVKAQCSSCAVRAGNDVRTMGSLGTGRQYLPDRGMTQPFGATQPILHILIVSPHQPPAICHTLTRDCQLSATSRWAAVRGKKTPRPAEHGSDPRKPLVILHTPHPSNWYLQVPGSGVPSVASPVSIYGHSRQDSRGGQHSTPGVRPSQYQHSSGERYCQDRILTLTLTPSLLLLAVTLT